EHRKLRADSRIVWHPLEASRLAFFVLCLFLATLSVHAEPAQAKAPSVGPRKKVAALVADWFHNSHPDILFNQIFQTYSRDNHGLPSQLQLMAVYRDLPSTNDLTEKYAAQ